VKIGVVANYGIAEGDGKMMKFECWINNKETKAQSFQNYFYSGLCFLVAWLWTGLLGLFFDMGFATEGGMFYANCANERELVGAQPRRYRGGTAAQEHERGGHLVITWRATLDFLDNPSANLALLSQLFSARFQTFDRFVTGCHTIRTLIWMTATLSDMGVASLLNGNFIQFDAGGELGVGGCDGVAGWDGVGGCGGVGCCGGVADWLFAPIPASCAKERFPITVSKTNETVSILNSSVFIAN
jgi:hypothetical protein